MCDQRKGTLFFILFYMVTQNKAGTLLPPTGENYPSCLIEASSHIRTAAHLVDQQLSRLPDRFRQVDEIRTELVDARDDLWSIWTSCCEKIALILTNTVDL